MMIGITTSMHGITIKSLLNDLPLLSAIVFGALVAAVGASVVTVVQLVVDVTSTSSTVVTSACTHRHKNTQKDCGHDVCTTQYAALPAFSDYVS